MLAAIKAWFKRFWKDRVVDVDPSDEYEYFQSNPTWFEKRAHPLSYERGTE